MSDGMSDGVRAASELAAARKLATAIVQAWEDYGDAAFPDGFASLVNDEIGRATTRWIACPYRLRRGVDHG